ncbi:hypothetical protein CMI38_07060 [Candidatus Pacearchaeota archaeon]|nr:hypothetical protein [Candidatus Pacearchaeota archaeon]
MKKRFWVFLLVLFFMPFVFGSVFINEVEINPEGSDSGNEWIELYNNESSALDISGWRINDSDGEIHVVPDFTTLTGNSFYVFDVPTSLLNSGEVITLVDENGVLMDVTASLADASNDNDSWQRIADGVGSFVFTDLTKGVSNYNNLVEVPAHYSSIQDAIDNAIEGDMIEVDGGVYVEDLVIGKGVKIIGAGFGTTTLTGSHVISSSDVEIEGFTFVTSGTTFVLDSSLETIEDVLIENNTFDLTSSPSVGIHFGGGSPAFGVSDVVIDNNVFNGPVSMVCNPWKIGGSFGIPLSVEIDDIDFINNEVDHCSIPINLYDGDINDVLIDGNVFRDTDGVVYVWHDLADPDGKLSRFVFTNNDVDGTNSYGVGIDTHLVYNDSNFGVGNKVNHNDFIGVVGDYGFGAVSLLSPVGSYELDAEYNNWGSCDGPSDAGTGGGSPVSVNVDFDPWIGICFGNKTASNCSFEDLDARLSADVSGEGLDDVWFSYTIDGVNYNNSGSKVGGTENTYEYEINSSLLNNGTVAWNVYAEDEFGNVFFNGVQNLIVRAASLLSVAPSGPDGDSFWYVSEPLFSLLGDVNGLNIYYRWDSVLENIYAGPFGLEGIPNAPPLESAGILELNYYSEFVCGNESVKSEMFYVDLQDPVIVDLVPLDGEVIYNTLRPEVSAYLDEVYQGNSGINHSSVVMKINGGVVSAVVVGEDSVDASVSYTPESDLTEGDYEVYVSVSDNAGRASNKTWMFTVNTSSVVFDLIVNSPSVGYYGTKRLPFNITTSEEVVLIEYINYNDRTPRWKRLCRNCDEYGMNRKKTKRVREGENNISVRATDQFGNIMEVDVGLMVDSKKPKVSRVLPRRNKVTNGSDFYVRYSEDNVENVTIMWNPLVVLSECTESGRNSECFFGVDLTGFDGQEIEYVVRVSDSLRSVSSRTTKVKVDLVSPELVVNMPENKTGLESYEGKVPFNISVSEKVKLEYYDESASRPRWRRLCVRCNEYGTDRSRLKRFKDGVHSLIVRAVDEAGNSDEERIVFEVV